MGNVAGNTLIFGQSIMYLASNTLDVNYWAVRGVALAVATAACLLHTVSRTAGIYINNGFGFVKIAMLLALFIVGTAYAGGSFGGTSDTAKLNLSLGDEIPPPSSSAFGYAQAFLGVLFSFGGFHQANYVSLHELVTRFILLTILGSWRGSRLPPSIQNHHHIDRRMRQRPVLPRKSIIRESMFQSRSGTC